MIRRKGKALDKPIYANLLLRDGKILAWSTCNRRYTKIKDFSMSFYYTRRSLKEEVNNGAEYVVLSRRLDYTGKDGFKEAQEFYREFEICKDCMGVRAY